MAQKTKERHGEVRCLNCFERFYVAQGATKDVCPKCKMEWRISWPYPDTAKIRGPVWEKLAGGK
jgi:rRNA maturation endonuclease Nob1